MTGIHLMVKSIPFLILWASLMATIGDVNEDPGRLYLFEYQDRVRVEFLFFLPFLGVASLPPICHLVNPSMGKDWL